MLMEQTDRQIENDRARVTRLKMAPGAHTGLHRYEYDYIIVPVTNGRMRLVQGGRESIVELTAGVAFPCGRGRARCRQWRRSGFDLRRNRIRFP